MRSIDFQGAEFASSVTFIWCLRFHSDLNGTRNVSIILQPKQSNVCVLSSSKEWAKDIVNKDFKRKLTTSSGRKKIKASLNLELIVSIVGKEFP